MQINIVIKKQNDYVDLQNDIIKLFSPALDRELVPIWDKFKNNKNDCIFQQSSMAEDMGLEEVRIVQTLKFQGGKAPSTLVPGIVPSCFEFLSFAIGWNMPLLAL